MTKIEIFMMLYSLLLGLALTALLASIGELLRGRESPRWGVFVPIASAVLFMTLLAMFSDAYYYRDRDLSFRSIGFPVIVGVLYYLAAVLTVPREHDGWSDLDAFFMARKHLIFGCQLAALLVAVFGVEVPRSLAQGREIFSENSYWIGNGSIAVLLAIPIVSRRRTAIVAAMVTVLLMMGYFYLNDEPLSATLGRLRSYIVGV